MKSKWKKLIICGSIVLAGTGIWLLDYYTLLFIPNDYWPKKIYLSNKQEYKLANEASIFYSNKLNMLEDLRKDEHWCAKWYTDEMISQEFDLCKQKIEESEKIKEKNFWEGTCNCAKWSVQRRWNVEKEQYKLSKKHRKHR
ncbi:MAG: hypothetical protein FWE50_01685 [Alphaproteobacteria bacterium]|nr:hypothetical protein [Alphaproteobacteria bacterium]